MTAVMRENREAFVSGRETIELSISSLREKMDRDHAALAANQTALAANQTAMAAKQTAMAASQAAIIANQTAMAASQAALSENQSATAAKLSALSERVHENFATLLDRINTVHHVLRDKIEENNAVLSAGLTTLRDRFDATTQELSKHLGNKIEAVDKELRGLHKTVLWVCGSIVTIVTVGLGVGKAVGWI